MGFSAMFGWVGSSVYSHWRLVFFCRGGHSPLASIARIISRSVALFGNLGFAMYIALCKMIVHPDQQLGSEYSKM
jgi:hypothetical protein